MFYDDIITEFLSARRVHRVHIRPESIQDKDQVKVITYAKNVSLRDIYDLGFAHGKESLK